MNDTSSEQDRVREHTPSHVNARIDAETRTALEAHAASPPGIQVRLAEIDREWNVDRALMANFAILGGLSFALAMRTARPRKLRGNGWFYLFSTQLGFLLYHSVFGWCPPAAVFRRLGFRTGKEICAERHALLDRLQPAGR